MAEQTLERALRVALWQQFGAALDMLENALLACPDALWTERVWYSPPESGFPATFSQFWAITFHVLAWLDLYLAGVPEEEFVPPPPFAPGERDSAATMPEQPYSKAELRGYLVSIRQKCRNQLLMLSDERMRRPVEYPWSKGQPISFLELQLYNLRHVQEHVAHLSLFLGQHNIPDEKLHWVARAEDEPGR